MSEMPKKWESPTSFWREWCPKEQPKSKKSLDFVSEWGHSVLSLKAIPVKSLKCNILCRILFRGRPFNSWSMRGRGGDGWSLVSKCFFFSSNRLGRIFFPLLIALQDIFFLSSFLCSIFFSSKKCRVYIYRMYLHLRCGYCSNSSNMELQSLKML